jgi:hypothetical protein
VTRPGYAPEYVPAGKIHAGQVVSVHQRNHVIVQVDRCADGDVRFQMYDGTVQVCGCRHHLLVVNR